TLVHIHTCSACTTHRHTHKPLIHTYTFCTCTRTRTRTHTQRFYLGSPDVETQHFGPYLQCLGVKDLPYDPETCLENTHTHSHTHTHTRSEEHTSALQSHLTRVCRLLLEKKTNVDRSHARLKISVRH